MIRAHRSIALIVAAAAMLAGQQCANENGKHVAVGQAPGGPPPCSTKHELAVQLVPQHTSLWCWAASGQMVMKTVRGGREVPQCKQATDRLAAANQHYDCCKDPVPSQCVQPGWPNFPLYSFTQAPRHNGPLSWDEIKDQIDCKQAPVAFSWRYHQGGGHMMTLGGYVDDGTSRWVTVYDPLEVDQGNVITMTYDAYTSGPTYEHWFDYYNVAVKQ